MHTLPSVFSILIVFLFNLPRIQSFHNEQIVKIFQQIEEKNKRIQTLSYESTYKSINPAIEKSIFQTNGKIWLQSDPADTIFGCRFHVQGKDTHGTYDYFYDGQNSYEIRHPKKAITIFNPYAFENTPNNPAKARTALSPFVYLLINKNLKFTMLKNNPETSLTEDELQDNWIITLKYPENSYGQILNRKIFIDKSNLYIKKIETRVYWRGMTYSTSIKILNYEINNPKDLGQIFLTKKYENYTRKVFQRHGTQKIPHTNELVGGKASDFTYASFTGEKITLSRLKGKYVLLDFWESWCGYCILALPKLNAIQKTYKNKIFIIGITTENKVQIEKLINANNLNYLNVFANKDILDEYKVTGRPTYVLIDTEGRIVKVSYGDLEEIESILKSVFEENCEKFVTSTKRKFLSFPIVK